MTHLNQPGLDADADAVAAAAITRPVRGLEENILREIIKDSSREGVISLAGGMPAEDLFDEVGLREAAAAVMERPQEPLQYGISPGELALRGQIAELMATRQVRVDADDLVVTTGASQALDLLGRAILGPDDLIAVERPTFLATLSVARLCEANVVEVPIDGQGLRVEEFERLAEDRPVKALYVMPTFSNPSGAVLPLERRRRLLEVAARRGVIVIEDDAYGSLGSTARLRPVSSPSRSRWRIPRLAST